VNEIVAAVLRGAILKFLDAAGVAMNDEVIAASLSSVGHPAARRTVREALEWLADRGLVATTEAGPYLVADITDDGRDVAARRLAVDGVERVR